MSTLSASAPITNSTRAMTLADVKDVMQIHLSAFPGFFLSFMGCAFLRELYCGILRDASGIALVCERGERLLGFVVGSHDPPGLYRRLLKSAWWRFILASIGPFLRRPSIAPRLLRALARGQQTGSPRARRGTLMSIAVAPENQAGGIGQILVRAFLSEARNRGVEVVDLTTDAVTNNAVHVFYQKLGFVGKRRFLTPEHRLMELYEIELH